MRLTTVAILCPGPSLHRHSYFDAVSVVAVGSAILHPWDAKHAWCTHSPVPEDHEPISDRLVRSGADIWCSEEHAQAFREAFSGSSEVYPHHRSPRAALNAAGLPASLNHISTTHIAIACAVAKGAAEVLMYGMDLYGRGTYDPETGEERPSSRPDSWWDARWQKERETYEAIVESLEDQGVELRAIKTPPRVI